MAAITGGLQARVCPNVLRAWEWVVEHRDLGPRFVVENTGANSAEILRSVGVASILGLSAFGYLQAANLLLGPFRVVLVGVATTAVSEGARILHHTPRRLPVFSAAVSLGLAGLAAAWGVVLLLALPQGLGDLVLGDLWQPAYPLVLPLTISLMASCFRVGAGIGLHALGAARRSMRIGLITPAAVVACDLYARDYLRSCVGVLDEHPEAALAHAWCVLISEDREPIQFFKYPTATSLPRAPDRFRSLLFDGPYDWTYAVFRTEICVRRLCTAPTTSRIVRSWPNSPCTRKLLQVPEWMYFRRDHPNRHQSPRARSASSDPRRANRLRHPSARLYSEYVWGYASAVNRSRLSRREKGECYRELVRSLATRIAPSAQPEEERETFRTQPVLHVLRRLAGIAHQERELPVGEVATHELPDIRVDELVLGQDS